MSSAPVAKLAAAKLFKNFEFSIVLLTYCLHLDVQPAITPAQYQQKLDLKNTIESVSLSHHGSTPNPSNASFTIIGVYFLAARCRQDLLRSSGRCEDDESSSLAASQRCLQPYWRQTETLGGQYGFVLFVGCCEPLASFAEGTEHC